MIREITYPFTIEQVSGLRVGEIVYVSGRIFTARDRIHRHLFDGGRSPVKLRSGAIYHCGPIAVRKKGLWKILAAGPTTSLREEPYMQRIIKQRKITVIIGKGGMGEQTRKTCAICNCVYLHAVGGAAQVLADKVEKVLKVHFLKEFGPAEAMWEFIVRKFPAIVTIDSRGRSLHKQIAVMSNRNVREELFYLNHQEPL